MPRKKRPIIGSMSVATVHIIRMSINKSRIVRNAQGVVSWKFVQELHRLEISRTVGAAGIVPSSTDRWTAVNLNGIGSA